MLHNVKLISDLSTKIDNFFSLFKGKILSLTTSQWNEEDFKGKSYIQWDIIKYYHLLYLLILLNEDINRLRFLNKDWSYFSNKYNLDNFSKCLACNNISFVDALVSFDLYNESLDLGIQTMNINNTFKIALEDNNDLNTSKTIIDLITVPNYCQNNI